MEKLMNVENEWRDSIDANKVEDAVRKIEVEEVRWAMNRMKIEKASGPSGFALELFKAGWDKCLIYLVQGQVTEEMDFEFVSANF